MKIWRINCKPGGQFLTQKDQFDFWIKNNFIGIGWSSAEKFDEGFKRNKNSNEEIKEIKNFIREKEKTSGNSTSSFSAASNILVDNMSIGDFIWVRYLNRYKLGQIRSNGLYNFNSEVFDGERQIGFYREVEYFEKDFSESEVPGKIVASYRASRTVQNVKDYQNTIEEYCKAYISNKDISFPIEKWFFILHSDDIEEIIGLYLQIIKKLFVYTSTNKKETGEIECELVDIRGNHYGFQVKSGNESLDANDYKNIAEKMKIYLFASSGDVKNLDINSNIEKIEISEVTQFLRGFKYLLPERIKRWFK